MNSIDVVIMAAGKGTRMKSRLPKVLHKLAGRPLLEHVMSAADAVGARSIVVITGNGAEGVERAAAKWSRNTTPVFVRQEPQLGTGHAVQQAAPKLPGDGVALILNGDVPLVAASTLRELVDACGGERLALLTIDMSDPAGYGRIVREGESVVGIVEHKDASEKQRAIREVYTGFMAVPAKKLKPWLARLTNDNAQREYYLTDIVGFAVQDGERVVAVKAREQMEVDGVNSPSQLAALERQHQRREAERLMEQGVRIADPARFDVRGSLECASDVEIDVNCIFEGRVLLGEGVRIGANCIIANATIEAGAEIQPFTHIDGEKAGVTVGKGARVGPFARLRPGAKLGEEVHIGNFVEVKNSTLAKGAKANHLAYLGDSIVGERVNYGAGSITANYDGANKHQTVIEADVHVGSNCVIVAPVKIGEGGTIGAGSVITKDTPAKALSIARGKQVSIANWERPKKTPK